MVVLGLLAGAVDSWGYSASAFGTVPWWIVVMALGLVSFVISQASLSVSLLVLSGILFGITHVVPYGPLGMACFVIAVALIEFAPHRVQMTQSMESAAS
jgi:hypothetical protein